MAAFLLDWEMIGLGNKYEGAFMKFTELLFEENQDIWQAYYDHPFIIGLGDGSLDIEKFKFYMIQDYLYLWDYSKLFAIGALKSEDEEIIGEFAKYMDFTINGEMNIHRAYMKDLGISKEELKNAQVSLINLSYTNYMLSVAQKGGYEEVVAALLSCAWTYADIAKYIDEKYPKAREDEFYGNWISSYASEDFQVSAQTYKDRIDDLAENLDEKRKSYLANVFRNCCIYELKFWDMAYNMSYDFGAIN